MPSITLVTNVKLGDDEIGLFIQEFTKFCSDTIGKPENQFCVDFNHNPHLALGGTFSEPVVKMHVTSLWNTTPENAQRWAEAFFRYFETRLGVPQNRGHLTFTDPGDQFTAVGGTTMAALKARR